MIEAFLFMITRVIDADTLEGDILLQGLHMVHYDQRVRLDCIDAPEGRNSDLAKWVREELEGELVYITGLGDGGFGRILASVYVPSWGMTLEQALFDRGAPLYEGLTSTARENCLDRLTR